MIRGTTPKLTFNLPIDTSTLKNVYVTFADQDKNVLLEKETAECQLSDKSIAVKLTQEETLEFTGRQSVLVQLRMTDTAGEAFASKIYTVHVDDILKDGVIE